MGGGVPSEGTRGRTTRAAGGRAGRVLTTAKASVEDGRGEDGSRRGDPRGQAKYRLLTNG